MFNLEQAIAEWRKRMRAAGIQSPVPLEELEEHLREEIEAQVNLGRSEAAAFEVAAQNIGPARGLTAEFNKAGGSGWLAADKDTQINRGLGLLWLIYCAGSFWKLTHGLRSGMLNSDFRITPLFLAAVLMDLIYLRGLVGSILLMGGVSRERRFILLLAILDAVGGVVVLLTKPFQPLSFAYTIIGFASIWLLWPPQKPKLTTR